MADFVVVRRRGLFAITRQVARLDDDNSNAWLTHEELVEEYDRMRGGPCFHCRGPCRLTTRWDHHCEWCGVTVSPEGGSWHYCRQRQQYAHAHPIVNGFVVHGPQRDEHGRPK
jgi:hypothetical protein